MKKLENKTVFITGGLSGLGRACAMAAATEGANVAIAAPPPRPGNNALEEIRKLNPAAIFMQCDVANAQQVEAAIQQTIETFSTIDVALNNAGVGGDAKRVAEVSDEGWLKVINVNLNGVFYCMKYELKQMAKQGSGVIINMSSVLGKVAMAYASHYTASKHAVMGLTKAAALEYALMGIRINALCPAFIETPMLEKTGVDATEERKQYITGLHPMKRLGTGEEVANAFIFLASDDSPFITGASLDIDGGYLAK